MEPSKRYSLISLFFILKCLSKTLVIRMIIIIIIIIIIIASHKHSPGFPEKSMI